MCLDLFKGIMNIKVYKIVAVALICGFGFSSCLWFSKKDEPEKPVYYETEIPRQTPMPAIFSDIKESKPSKVMEPDFESSGTPYPESSPILKKETVAPVSSEGKRFAGNFRVGEKVVYDVRLWKMKNAFGLNKGSAVFEIGKEKQGEKDCYVITGSAKGDGFGYKLNIDSKSYIDSETLLPVLSTNTQSGSERRKRKLVFYKDKIEYVKMKHCKNRDGCKIDAHYVYNEEGAKAHCRKCKDWAHYTWRVRSVHENEIPTYDLLSAFFLARSSRLEVGAVSDTMRLVDGRDLWEMNVHAIGEETIETEIGVFDTFSLKLETYPLNAHAKKQKSFRGLFGLKGDIGLWVDKKSKVPIRIRGVYPLLFDVQIEIIIKSIEGRVIDRKL